MRVVSEPTPELFYHAYEGHPTPLASYRDKMDLFERLCDKSERLMSPVRRRLVWACINKLYGDELSAVMAPAFEQQNRRLPTTIGVPGLVGSTWRSN
jgi:hypothetical protein